MRDVPYKEEGTAYTADLKEVADRISRIFITTEVFHQFWSLQKVVLPLSHAHSLNLNIFT